MRLGFDPNRDKLLNVEKWRFSVNGCNSKAQLAQVLLLDIDHLYVTLGLVRVLKFKRKHLCRQPITSQVSLVQLKVDLAELKRGTN